MAITVVQHVGATQNGVSSLSATVSSTGSGNLLVCGVTTFNSPAHAPSNVTDGTTNFTQFPSARVTWTGGTFTGLLTDFYYLPSSASGKTSITVNMGASTTVIEMEVWEVSGFTTVGTDGHADNGTTGGTCVSGTATGATVATSGSVGFIAAFCGSDTGAITANPKAGNAFTSGGDIPLDAFASLITSASGNYVPAWTDSVSSDQFTNVSVAFKETAVPVFVPHNTYQAPILTQ